MQHKGRPNRAFALDGVHVEFSVAVVEEATAGAVDEAAGARGGVREEEELGWQTATDRGSGQEEEQQQQQATRRRRRRRRLRTKRHA